LDVRHYKCPPRASGALPCFLRENLLPEPGLDTDHNTEYSVL
jgi:hypothetical protein